MIPNELRKSFSVAGIFISSFGLFVVIFTDYANNIYWFGIAGNLNQFYDLTIGIWATWICRFFGYPFGELSYEALLNMILLFFSVFLFRKNLFDAVLICSGVLAFRNLFVLPLQPEYEAFRVSDILQTGTFLDKFTNLDFLMLSWIVFVLLLVVRFDLFNYCKVTALRLCNRN